MEAAPTLVAAPSPPAAPSFAVLTYPPAPCLGPPRVNRKHARPVAPPPTCDAAKRQREAWLAGFSSASVFPTALPAAITGPGGEVRELSEGRDLVARGGAGALYVDIDAAGTIVRAIQGGFEPPIWMDDRRRMIIEVGLPTELAPFEYHVYDIVGATGLVEARLVGNASFRNDIAFGYAAPAFDRPALDEWMARELPPVRGPTLAITADQQALYDATAATWRVWSPTEAEARAGEFDVNELRHGLELGKAGVAFVTTPGPGVCGSRWFGPDDASGQVVCSIAAMPGGGARLTRAVEGGIELVDIDEHGAASPWLRLAGARADRVFPVPSPRADRAWEAGGRVTVQDANGARVVAAGVPLCRRDAPPLCAVVFARIVGEQLLIEEQRGPDYGQAHLIGLGRGELAKTTCTVHDVRHAEATSEALLECPEGWVQRTWTVADGSVRDGAPAPGRVAAAQGRPADAPLQLGGLQVCAVDGWLVQGDACTGLQRYNAKRGTLEPAP